MAGLLNKVDFVMFVSVTMANPNGDPLDGNYPRVNSDGFGEISDVCIKRKIRNRMFDLGCPVFVRKNRDDESWKTLKEHAEQYLSFRLPGSEFGKKACETWLDVRSFGQVFAYSGEKKGNGVSIGIRGPVSIHQGVSVSPVTVDTMQITKCVNGGDSKAKKGAEEDANAEPSDKKSSDTMGTKHFVRYGLYKIKGAINVQLAERTGFSKDDADIIKECLRTLFVNDTSSARPEGSMEVVKLYWFEHDCASGKYSSAKVHRSVEARLVDGVEEPSSLEDYEFVYNPLEGLEPEEIEGV